MSIQIVGFTSDYKVPLFAAETVYGAGAISQGSAPLKLLCIGLKTSGGSLTLDGTPQQALSEDDIDDLAGAGSELARMGYAALRQPGVDLWLAAPTGGGGAQATLTVTFATTASSAGTWIFRFAGVEFEVAVATGDTATVQGASFVAAIAARPQLPFSASNSSGTVTVTVKSAGVRGNMYIAFIDRTLAPGASTCTLTGGTAVTGGGVPFSSGTGTEDLTALLATIFPRRFDRIAAAQTDTTNLGRLKTHLTNAAGPLEGRPAHLVFATNGTLSAAASLSTSTLNHARFENLWLLYSETHPSELAALHGAQRAVTEQSDPAAQYDGKILPDVAPQSQTADWAQPTTQQTALNEGVTPLVTTEDGNVAVVRAITTHCLNGTDPDYRTLDTSQAVVPDYVRDGLRLIWETEIKPQNPRVAPDPATGQRERPAGIITPKRWNDRVTKYLKDLETAGVVINVDTNLPTSEYDTVGNRIMSVVPVVPTPGNHQIGVSVRQLNVT